MARTTRLGFGLALGLSLSLAGRDATATCMQLDTFSCEIIPTYGDCKSPETNVWAPGAPFTYRIGCEGSDLSSADLLLDGKILKAKPEPLRQCEQWSLWVLEEPLPAGATLRLSAAAAAKPVQLSLAIADDAAKQPRVAREPKHDFVCSVQRIDPPPVELVMPRSGGGCAGCVSASREPTRTSAWAALALSALALGRRGFRPRRA